MIGPGSQYIIGLGYSVIALFDFYGKVVKVTDQMTMYSVNSPSAIGPSTIMYYKYTDDYSKYIIQTYDIQTGKFSDLFTT